MLNTKKAKFVIDFIEMLCLTDDFYGQPFVLQEWQRDLIMNVYGTVTKENPNIRQYNFAYLEIAKKNTKTTLVAAFALMHLTTDPKDGQIFCCAADRAQAGIVYKAAVSMIEQNSDIASCMKITESKKEIKNITTGTILKVLSAEAYTKHGLNPNIVIFDELHAQPDRKLWDAMTFGAGSARKQPLWWVITTAGDDADRLSIGWEQHNYARQIIDGEIVDPSWYAKIYAADETDDIYDEEVWKKANPSIGVSISYEAVRKEAILARNSAPAEKLFRWLRLNQWLSSKRLSWLDLTLWDSTTGKWNLSDMVGMKCYLGLDLASTVDLTGMALLFPPQEGLEEWRFVLEGWVPEDNMKERVGRDHVPYDRWAAEKYLFVTPGNTCDYDFIRARIEMIKQQFVVKYLCCDPWNSRTLTQQLAKTGTEVIEITQNIAGLSPGMKELERLLKIGNMTHEKNPLGRWCFGNMSVAIDGNENLKPMKNKARDRIDPICALINAMNVAVKLENTAVTLYEKRGMRIL